MNQSGVKNIKISKSLIEPFNPSVGDIWINWPKKFIYTIEHTWKEVQTDEVYGYAGTLWMWGYNSHGQLGLGDIIHRSSPVQVGGLADWVSLSIGERHTLAIKQDGTLWTWGRGTYGRLGHNDVVSRSSPVQVGTLTIWKHVACTYQGSLATQADGTLWSWGYNFYGELGLMDLANRSSPTQIGSLTIWDKVFCGNASSFGIQNDGTLWSWGYNAYGRLGLGDVNLRSSPTQVGSGTQWQFIDCQSGASVTLAIRKDNTLWAWGYNAMGQLGVNDTFDRATPIQIGNLATWLSIGEAGDANCVCLRMDDTLWVWGENYLGELGLNNLVHRSSPVQLGNVGQWKRAISGSFFIDKSEMLWACGGDGYGTLGQNTLNASRSSPIQIGSLAGWKKVFKGANSFTVGGPAPCSVAAIR